MLFDVLFYAADQHRDQRRKDEAATPYINHPIALLHILSEEAGIADADVLVAAVLHDVLEDCSGPAQEFIEDRRREIADQFGDSVLAIVEAVTDDKRIPKSDRKRLQVEHAAHLPLPAKLVKLADKTANLRDITATPPSTWSPERIEAYGAWAAEVVDQMRGSNAVLEQIFDAALSKVAANRFMSPSPPRNSPPLPPDFDKKFAEALRDGIKKGIETP